MTRIRIFGHCVRVSVIIVILLVLAVGGFVWRLTAAPVDIGFAKDYLESALRDPERGVHASMDRVVLHWPDLSEPIFIGLHNGKIVNDAGETVISVEEAALSLSLAKLFTGKVVPKALVLKKPSLKVIRKEDSGFDIGFGTATQDLGDKAERQTDIVTRIVEYIAKPGDEAGETSPLASLEAFEIQEARVVVEDHVLGISWFLPRFDIAFFSTNTGLSSSLYFDLPNVEGEAAHIRGDADFSWERKDIALALGLKNFDTHIFAGKIPALAFFDNQNIVLDGKVEALLGADLRPLQATVNVSSAQGSILAEELSSSPVPYRDFFVEASYDDEKHQLDVARLQITLKDVTASAKAKLTQGDNTITGPVSVEVNDLPQKDIGPIWPDALKDDNSRVWIVENITGGTYTSASATLDLMAAQDEAGEWNIDAKNILADFAFEDMSVNYRPPLSPVTAAKGRGRFIYDEEKLSVTVEEGMLEDMKVVSGEVELVNIISEGTGVADIHLQLDGPAKTALLYAAKEPIDLHKKVNFDMNAVKGHVALDVKLDFPTIKDLKMEQLNINIEGDLRDVYVPDVLKGMALSEGPLTLSVTNKAARIEGKGKLDGRPVDLTWMEYLESKGKPHKSKVTARIVADPALRERFGIVLDEFLEGPIPVDVVYTEFAGGRAEADVKVDTKPARFFAKPFDYEKPEGVPGSASLKALFEGGVLREVRGLKGTAPGFTLEDSLLTFRQKGPETILAGGTISRFTLGETVGKVDFEIADSGRMKIVMNGPFLDLRPFLAEDEGEKKAYDDPPVVLSVAADAMRTADEQVVQYAKIYADIDHEGRFNQLELDAIAGKGDVYLRFKPDETGKRIFRLEADDAGATLKAFSVYDKIVGGKLIAYGEPIRGVYDRNLIGLAEISDFKVVKAPALARLLGAISLTGIVNLLGDEGVSFTKMEADFNWLYRKRGSLLVLKNGRTSGNSLGLTFDGVFDKAEGTVDASGTIVPLSLVNEIIGAIPLFGDILTGGSGGVFAATYTVKGKATEPEISVNPLSVLTPGILRRILFE